VELTWDEEDQNRVKAIKEAFTNMGEGEDINNKGDLIGSASEAEGDDEEGQGSEVERENEMDAISKCRVMLRVLEVIFNDGDITEDQEKLTP